MRLTPLRPEHTDVDHAAVVASRAFLRAWSGSDWPGDDFTAAENRVDLERHAREHDAGVAWTWTVLEGPTCVGCVYLNPVQRILDHRGVDLRRSGWCVALWSRSDRPELAEPLLARVRGWLPMERPDLGPVGFFTRRACGQGDAWTAAGLVHAETLGPFDLYREPAP